MALIAVGLGDKEIAARLGLSHGTVRTHIQRIYDSHNLRNRAEAAAAWIAYSGVRIPDQEPVARPPRRRAAWVVVGAAAVAVVGCGLLVWGVLTATRSESVAGRPAGVLAAINLDRRGLPPVRWDACLGRAAQKWAQALAHRGYVGALVQPSTTSCGRASGVELEVYWSQKDAAAVNRFLRADPNSRQAIRGPYEFLGAAWETDSAGTAFLVVLLA